MKKNILIILIGLLGSSFLYGQTGPAGIGNAGGTSGQPKNILWVRANDLSLTDGTAVNAWADSSGNGNDLSRSASETDTTGDPVFYNTVVNGYPVIRFSSTSGTTGTKLKKNSFNSFTGNEVTTFVIYRTKDTGEGIISYAITGNSNDYLLYNSGDFRIYTGGNYKIPGVAYNDSTFTILTEKWRNSDDAVRLFRDGTQNYSNTLGSGNVITNGGCLAIGGEQDAVDGSYDQTQALDGDIAEIIMFDTYLNDAQRTIIENYLNVKYGIAIGNDVFTSGDANYKEDITGIGQEADGNWASSSSAGMYLVNNGALDDGDYIMTAHDATTNAVSTADLPTGVVARWAKDWYIEQTGTQNLSLKFDLPEGISGGQYPQTISNYVLLYRNSTTGNYDTTTVNFSVNYGDADQVAFNITGANLANGYYTLGTKDETNSPVEGAASTTWYSLVSGDWNDWETWTLDPSGALPNNPDHLYPQKVSDKVVIKSGKTVTMNVNNIHNASLDVDGRLDLVSTSGHTFDNISGSGRILLSSDNFPSYTDASQFTDAGNDEGTVVYYGSTSYNLANAQTFYNMELNLDAGQTLSLLNDLTANGNLTINQGTFQINDNSATTNLNITVGKDLTIASAGLIHTGTANARHQLNLYGDLTNNGELKLTNRTSADYANEATDGIVDANFLNTSKDQTISCNGLSNFYRIEIDKGTDYTYILDMQATNTSNFNLFGYANESHSSTSQLTDNNNALGLIKGTVKIGSNIIIPVLSTGGNYNVSAASRLWVADGTVQKNSGNSLVPYGVIKVSSGLLEAKVGSGITIRDNGLIKVSGGTVNTNVIRTSVLGASNVGGYVQTGGTVNIVDAAHSTSDYYHFCLTYPGNVFSMTGGILHVYDTHIANGNEGGIFIASDPANINVTGGTVIAEIAESTDTFEITSKAPFYNLILRNTLDNTTDFKLSDASDISSTDEDLAAQPLVVLNDLTIEDNCFLDNNGQNITIGGNFNISENSQQQGTNNYGLLYDATKPYTLTFNGSGSDTLYIGHDVDDEYELYLSNLAINKSTGSEIVLKGDPNKDPTQTSLSAEWHNRLIKVNDTIDAKNGTFNQGHQSIRLYGPVYVRSTGILGVYEPGVTTLSAYIMLKDDGTSSTDLNTEKGAQLGNFKLNPGDGKQVGLLSNTYIKRIGYYSGSMNLRSYNLKVDYLHRNSTTNNFASSNGAADKMIFGDGDASDGGLSILVTDNATYSFPVGVSGKYTPVKIDVSNFNDDGYITINPVDHYLWTLASDASKVLDYYWTVDHNDFSVNPDVYFTFYYNNGDVNGPESSYRAARIINYKTIESLGNWSVDASNDEFYYADDDAPHNPIILTKGDYTVGIPAAFNTSVRTLYARKNGEWHDYTTWSTTADGNSPLSNKNQLPTSGDIVVIGESTINGDENKNYAVAISSTNADYAPINIAMLCILRYGDGESSLVTVGQNGADCNFGVVTNRDPDATDPSSTENHASKIIISGPNLPSGDFGEYLAAPNTIWTYSRAFPGTNAAIDDGNGGTLATTYYSSYTIGNTISEYPVLQFEYDGYNSGYIELPDVDITVHNDIRFFKGDHHIQFNTSANGNVLAEKDIEFNSGNNFNIEFQETGTARTLTVKGNIDFKNNANGQYSVTNAASTLIHTIKLEGNVINPSGSSAFNCYNGTGNAMANIEFTGEANTTFANMTTIPDFNQMIMNKGSNQTYSMDIQTNFALGGDAAGNSDKKPIQLQNGTLSLNNTNINTGITTGGENYKIPNTSCLQISQGSLTASGNSGIELSGKLLIDGGSLDMSGGDNFIQYSASGSATIDVSAGSLTVGSQIRRGTTSDQGILTYNQSGGTVEIGNSAAGQNSRGIFEILNTGSSFTLSGGSFSISNDYRSNPSTQSVIFNPETFNMSTGTSIQFGNANTVSGKGNFTLYASKPIKNLITDNTSGYSPKVTMQVVPLTIEENLSIGSGTEFDANGLNLVLNGNFTNNGTFTANSNNTIFNGTVNQTITGVTSFYNLIDSCTASLLQANDITVGNELHLTSGTLEHSGNVLHAQGDVYSTISTTSSTVCDGIIFEGTSQQQIIGSGSYKYLTTNNPSGVIVPTGYTTTITGSLNMKQGIFDIGKNLLAIEKSASINEVNPFSSSNMVQTNISFTDAGIIKYFPTISSSTNFTYPIGSNGKYTPVSFNITNSATDNMPLRVKAADEIHPTILNDAETPDPEIPDTANVLKYYWILDATGASNFTGTAIMQADPNDVQYTSPYDSTYYITARLLDRNSGLFDKYSVTDFNETSYELSFSYNGTDDNGINGDYLAGVDSSGFNGAIPDQVPKYISNQDGDWTDQNIWTPTSPAGGPKGAIVIVRHNVTVPKNYIVSYETQIDNGGKLSVNNTFGHRLGNTHGTGTLYLERGDMPAANYEGFFAADSGTVEFGGTTDYDILSETPSVNNLILSGTGQRRLPNLALQLLGSLTIDGPEMKNEQDKSLSIKKDITFTSGTFTDFTNGSSKIELNGSSTQTISGAAAFTTANSSAINNLKLNNPAGINLNTSMDINKQIDFTSGKIITSTTNQLTILNTDNTSNPVINQGTNSFVDGPLYKKINNLNYFDFPVGDGGRYGHVKLSNVSTSGSEIWMAQYFNHDATSDGYDVSTVDTSLQSVYPDGYWNILSPVASTTADVKIRWDGATNAPSSSSDRAKLRVAEWLSSSTWSEVGNIVTDNSQSDGYIETSAGISFNELAGGDYFAIGSDIVAQSKTWVGTTTDWATSTNWTPEGIPTSSDQVTIPESPTGGNFPVITSAAQAYDLTLDANASIIINPNYSLVVGNQFNITSGASALVKADATGSASLITNGTITNNGTCSMEIYLTTGIYHYISMPNATTASSTFETLDGYTNPNWYYYDEVTGYDDWNYAWLRPSGTLNVAQGYALALDRDKTYTLSGTFNSGNQSINITKSGTQQSNSWNLIGNPYPSAISIDDIINSNSGIFTGTVYLWDDDHTGGSGYTSSDYATYTLSGSTSGGGGKTPNGYIAPGQAFMVQASVASGAFTLDNSMRRTNVATFFKSNYQDSIARIRLYVVNSNSDYNEMLICFHNGATKQFDELYDGRKVEGNSNISLYSLIGDDKMAIQALPQLNKDITIPIGINVGSKTSGTHTINVKELANLYSDINIYLRDNETDSLINLRTNNSYTFTASAGRNNQRFELICKVPEISQTKWQGGVAGNWNEATNWSNGIPTPYKNAIIESGSAVAANDIAFNNMTINPGAAVELNQGINVDQHGEIKILADENGIGSILDKGALNIKQAIVEHYFAQSHTNYMVSSPITNGTASIFGTQSQLNGTEAMDNRQLSLFNNSWQSITNAKDNLVPMKALQYFVEEVNNFTVNFKGELNNEDYSTNIDTTGFVAIGNPYPSFIDWDNTTSWTGEENLAADIYVQSGINQANYSTYNRLSGIATNGGSPSIEPTDAFIVYAKSKGNLSVTKNARTAMAKSVTSNTDNYGFKFKLSSGNYSDEFVIFENNNATSNLDDYDTPKLFSSDNSYPQIYSYIGKKAVAVTGLPEITETTKVELNFKTETAGAYHLSMEKFGNTTTNDSTLKVFIVDNLNSDTTELSSTGIDYNFDGATNEGRFEIIFKLKTSSIAVKADYLHVFSYNKTIVVQNPLNKAGRIQIFELNGKKIAEKESFGGTDYFSIKQSGIYLLQFHDKENNIYGYKLSVQ